MEQRIQEKAEHLFFSFGLKSISMDDIAKEAGISKKTIYQYFVDKNSIVRAIVSGLVERQKDHLEHFSEVSVNAIDEMLMIAKSQSALISKVKPVVIYDLKKYFPDSWQLLKCYKEDSLKQACLKNFKTGISEGLYRQNLDTEVVCEFSLVQFTTFFNPENYPDRNKIQNVISKVTELFLYGIGSPQGQLVVKKYFDNTQQ